MEPPPPPAQHFTPVDPGYDRIEERFIAEEPVHFEERVPNVQQRLDRMTIDDDYVETRHTERVRVADIPSTSQDYLYYRLTKRGDDWTSCLRKAIPAPVSEIERKAKRGKGGDGPILDQLTQMSSLRREMLEDVIQRANDKETGNAHWEVKYIKSKRLLTKKGKTLVPEMDVILARNRGRSKSRAKSFAGEKIIEKEVVKEKKYVNDGYNRVRKDSVLDRLEDPVANLPVFESGGRPMDDLGPMHFNNANLPAYITPEMPLGAKPEKKGKKEKKGGKTRSKSRDRGGSHHDDGVYVVPEVQDFLDDAGDPAPVDAMFDDGAHDHRGRRGQSPHEHPVVVEDDPRRSHSRRRPDGRSKSRPRKESVHFPNTHTRQYFEGEEVSSENSDTSHYGFVKEYESSATSISTPGHVPRRGSLAYADGRPEVTYKTHHPGPSRRLSYQEKPYHGEQQQIVPARSSRRHSQVYYERPPEARYERPLQRLVRRETAPIPEDHQILYHEPAPRVNERDLVPLRRAYTAREPVIHHYRQPVEDVYYRDEVDRQSFRAEGYQRDRVLEDHISRREQEVMARERAVAYQEAELEQMSRREQEERSEQEYYEERERRPSRETRQVYYDAHTGKYYYYNE